MRNTYKKNKLQKLRSFCAVIEEGGALKAEKKLNLAQPNISLQVSSLEKDLNITLFKREKQRLIPTPEALRLYKICKKSVEEIDFIFEDAGASIKHDYDDKIRIAAHTYMLSHILPPYFKKIIEKRNNFNFELYNTGYEETIDLLNSGTIDFAVFPTKKEDLPKNIEAIEFYKCEFGIILHKNHPFAKVDDKDITWNLISQYDYISLGKKVTAQNLKSTLEINGIDSKFKLYNGTWEICLGLIKEELTISGADVEYAKGHKDIITKKCNHLMPDYKFYILTNKSCKISKASKDLLKILTHFF